MMILITLKNSLLLGLLFIFTCGCTLASAATNEADMSTYLSKARTMPPPTTVKIRGDGHPVTDKLAGKVIRFHYEGVSKGEVYTITFKDGQNLFWQAEDGSGWSRENAYAAFEVRENVYYLTWVEPTERVTGTSLEYGGSWLVSLVLDLNKMIGINSQVKPLMNGTRVHNVSQARLSMKKINSNQSD